MEDKNMKSYQSSTKERKINFFKRHKVAAIVTASVLVVALVVVLSAAALCVVLGVVPPPPPKPPGKKEFPDDNPPVVDVDTPPTIVLPLEGATIGMDYADDRLVKWETLELWKWHPAMDFVGSGNVVSIMDGTVTDIEKTTLDGNVVTVTHENGYVSVYKSLSSEISVSVGDTVKAGDKLGTTSTSMMSELNTGAHLHFELKKDGKYVNPASVLAIENDK